MKTYKIIDNYSVFRSVPNEMFIIIKIVLNKKQVNKTITNSMIILDIYF